MSDEIEIRPPRREESEELRELAERTFRAAFAADNEPSNLEAYVREAFSLERLHTELDDRRNHFLVAVTGGKAASHPQRLVGYGKLRRGTVEPSVQDRDAIELERIYADPEAIGRGIGAALMQALLEEAAALGHRTIWLGVWEHNPRAIEFYRRWGFEVVGSHVFRLGTDDQTDLVMQRAVEPPSR